MQNPIKFREEKLGNEYRNYSLNKKERLRRITEEREILHKEVKEYYDQE